jgi:hypothetical protein
MNPAKFFWTEREEQDFEFKKTGSKINLSNIFPYRNGLYLNEFNLFAALFNNIPNYISENAVQSLKANEWFKAYYKDQIKDSYSSKIHNVLKGKHEIEDVFYILHDDLIVVFDTINSGVRFLYKKTPVETVESIIKQITRFRKRRRRETPQISLIVNSAHGIDTKIMNITKPKLCISDNYNDDFRAIHEVILKRLSKPNDKGLVLLHGKPGTGKTSYIRYLLSKIKKEVIFMPTNMAIGIANPDLLSLLIDNSNSVLVIEDAENIIIDREKTGQPSVSTLLNLADGLLADCLNIQIICTFNTDISKIDSALMRKGRLIAKYEFKDLEIEKAQQLSNKLGFETTITKPMTLTSIYNQGEKDFQQPSKSNPIGFQVINNNRVT